MNTTIERLNLEQELPAHRGFIREIVIAAEIDYHSQESAIRVRLIIDKVDHSSCLVVLSHAETKRFISSYGDQLKDWYTKPVSFVPAKGKQPAQVVPLGNYD